MNASWTSLGNTARPKREALTWARWVLANIVGEAVGFGLGLGAALALSLPFGEPEGALLILGILLEILVVGVVEGLSVGIPQHWVLRPLLPGLTRRAWIRATIPGAVLAWGVGTAIGNWEGELLSAVVGGSWLAGGMLIGAIAGTILSLFQFLPLRLVARRAWVWVPAHASAWAIGMLVAFAGMGTLPENASALTVVGTASAVGVGMGVVVAGLTGLALIWVVRGEE